MNHLFFSLVALRKKNRGYCPIFLLVFHALLLLLLGLYRRGDLFNAEVLVGYKTSLDIKVVLERFEKFENGLYCIEIRYKIEIMIMKERSHPVGVISEEIIIDKI